jgi:hypothetical protein
MWQENIMPNFAGTDNVVKKYVLILGKGIRS